MKTNTAATPIAHRQVTLPTQDADPVQQGNSPKPSSAGASASAPEVSRQQPRETSSANSAQRPQVSSPSSTAASPQDSQPWLNKSSALRLNYQHGINLAEALEPGSSKRMTTEELIALPAKMSGEAVMQEQEKFVFSTRIGPTLDWAVANGILPEKADYSKAEVDKAVSEFEQYKNEMVNALTSLTTPVPMRKDYFTGTQLVSPIKGHADPDNPKYPVAIYDDKKFGDEFKADLGKKKNAYGTVVKHLLASLPVEDRFSIEHGEVSIFALKPPGEDADLERDRVLIKTVYNGKTTCYEVNPGQATIRKRYDLNGLFEGNSVIGKKKASDGTFSQEFFVWKKPQLLSNRYRPKVERDAGKLPDNEPFSSKLYSFELLGKLPSPAPHSMDEQAIPSALNSKRSNDLANVISDKLFYVKDLDLFQMAQEDPERVTEAEWEDRQNYQDFSRSRDERREMLKGFVPFLTGIEALVKGNLIEGVGNILIEILSSVMPVEKVAAGLVRIAFKGAKVIIKPAISPFKNIANEMLGFTRKVGGLGSPWAGAVPGVKWEGGILAKTGKGIEQFKINSTPLPRASAGIREIEFNMGKYFVASKPDAGDGVHYLLRVPDPNDPSKLVSSGIVATLDDKGVWIGKGSVGSGKTLAEGRIMQMGGAMREIKPIGNEIHTFVDSYKGGRRLNVVAHGVERGRIDQFLGRGSYVGIDNKLYTPQELVALLKSRGVNPADYDSVRLMVCYAGEGGAGSFANKLKVEIGKPVKAYEGVVTMGYGSTTITRIRNELVDEVVRLRPMISRENAERIADLRLHEVFSPDATTKVLKVHGDSIQTNIAPPGEPPQYKTVKVNYRPVHF